MPRKGPELRRLRAWRAWATSSLPEPLSPELSTVASVGATLTIRSRTVSMTLERPTIQFDISVIPVSCLVVPGRTDRDNTLGRLYNRHQGNGTSPCQSRRGHKEN